VIAEHLKTLSKGQLNIEGSELVVSADTTVSVRRPMQKPQAFNRNNKNKNNNNNKNRGKNYRRF
jgi:ribosome-binding protein aMBF1 (putative translation factor)